MLIKADNGVKVDTQALFDAILDVYGYNTVPVTIKDKKPTTSAWKTEEVRKQQFETNRHKWNTNSGIGILTGVPNKDGLKLHCIDIDPKNDPDGVIDELYLDVLKSERYDLYEKMYIEETQNGGIHLMFNVRDDYKKQKLAVVPKKNPNDDKEKGGDIIEIIANGGFIVTAPTKGYKPIQGSILELSALLPEEVKYLHDLAKRFDQRPTEAQTPKYHKTNHTFNGGKYKVTPWDDYNNRVTLDEVIQLALDAGFEKSREWGNIIFLKRKGSKNPYSAKIFKDNKIFYSFTAGTKIPAEKGLAPAAFRAWSWNGGEFSMNSYQLFEDGYGEELEDILEPEVFEPENDLDLSVLPIELQELIANAEDNNGFPRSFTLTTALTTLSGATGAKYGYKTSQYTGLVSLYSALVGLAGDNKSPVISRLTKPLTALEVEKKKEHEDKKNDYDALIARNKTINKKARYHKNNAKKRGLATDCFAYIEEVTGYKLEQEERQKVNKYIPLPESETQGLKKPIAERVIVQNYSFAKLLTILNENPRGVLGTIDEFKALVGNMNRHDNGNDIPDYLTMYTNSTLIKDTISGGNITIEAPYLSIIAGTQNEVLTKIMQGENLDNGFFERFIYAKPQGQLKTVDLFKPIDNSHFEWWDKFITDTYNDSSTYTTPADTIYMTFCKDSQEYIQEQFNAIDVKSRENNKFKKFGYVLLRMCVLNQILFNYSDPTKYSKTEISNEAAIAGVTLTRYYMQNMQDILDGVQAVGVTKKQTKQELFYDEFPADGRPYSQALLFGKKLGIGESTIKACLRNSRMFYKDKNKYYKILA